MSENDRDMRLGSETMPFCQTLRGFKGIGTYEWVVAEDRVVWSPELMAIYGVERAPDAERGFTEMVHPEDRMRVEAETSAFMGDGETYEHEFRIVRPNGEVRTVHDRGVIERSKDGSVRRMLGLNLDITELRQAEFETKAKLRESEARLQLAYEVADIGAWDLDLRKRRSVWSAGLYNLLGLEPAQPASDELFFEHVHPDDAGWLRERFREAIAARTTFDEVFRVVRRDGEARIVTGKGRVVEEIDGEPTRMIGVNYDITERMEAQEQSHLLMQEVNHRFKNMLSLIQVVARQTMQSQPAAFLERFNARIQALSAAQDMLVHNKWVGVDVEALVRSQLAHMKDAIGRRIWITGPRIQIKADAAQALGMAIHELLTNAGKYGSLSSDEGQVSIDWRLQTDPTGQRQFVISWIEKDGPPVVKPAHNGFGSVVIEKMTRNALDASVEVKYEPKGLNWRLQCSDGCLLHLPNR
ncbi:sensor histidine kinase [Aurantimonas sp. VKM B-3413]|uniref:sensor histidine kinase n=1 Tax=Aurantimonas sp. VKM B-3413 TaxID=2779401 RepID=UPI001E3D9C0A|nr:sensor histidine kinase [Aurantimonas sp. VKM B-3413]MCB8838002.1 PAS domain-containing protein [Aurantimonas sp. VKM B-3413]